MLGLKQAILRRSESDASVMALPLSRFTTTRLQILCWPLSIFFLLIILPSSGNSPPVSPSMAPEPLAQHYRDNYVGFRIGVVFVLLSAIAYPFYGIGVSNILIQIPGVSLVMVMVQAAAGVVVGLMFMTAGILFGTITFRLDRDPALVQLLSDIAWLYFTMLIPMLIFQDLIIGSLIRADHRRRPIVPRWLAWINELLPLGWFGVWGTHCVQSGPFAWNGAITFWLTVASYGVHIVANTVLFWIAAGEPGEM